jgi:hypothetical protein
MIIIPAQLKRYSTGDDRCLKVTFETNELTPNESAQIHEALQKFGYLAFKQENFTRDEQDAIEGLETHIENTGKTPSQRLRNVLLVWYKHDAQGFSTFNLFYEHHMEKIINHFKTKLP